MRTLLWAIAICFLAAPAMASEKKASEAPVEIRGYVPVQLRPFSVPTEDPQGMAGLAPVTMYMVVRGQHNVEVLCRYLPRIREAIALVVDQKPVPVSHRGLSLEDTQARLHSAINRALPDPIVKDLYLASGVRKIGAGAEMLDLPGTGNECQSLKTLPPGIGRAGGPDVAGEATRPPTNADVGNRPPERAAPEAPPQTTPDRAAPVPEGPAITVERLKTQAPTPFRCRELADVWSPSFHPVSGTRYWLKDVFTLDDNNDGGVDNVGFILKAEGKTDLRILYFPAPGQQSVLTVPTLRLGDDRDVTRLCPGQIEFEKPDRRHAIQTGAEPQPGHPAAPPAHGGGSTRALVVFAVVIGAGVLLLVGGGVGFAMARRRADRRRKERRRVQERRKAQRRQRTEAPPETERRSGADRRGPEDRRREDDRRQADDRRGTEKGGGADKAEKPEKGEKPDEGDKGDEKGGGA